MNHPIRGALLILVLAGCGGSGGTGPIGPPLAPGGVQAVAGDGTVTVSWKYVAGADGYRVYWAQSPGVSRSSAAFDVSTSPYHHTGRTNGVKYYYRIAAVGGLGQSPLSIEVSATPAAP